MQEECEAELKLYYLKFWRKRVQVAENWRNVTISSAPNISFTN